MSRSLRSRKRLGLVAAVSGVAAGIAVLIVATVGTAAPAHVSKAAAGHKCLVMTGSGDLAFVRNFNPYTSTGIPSGQFVKGSVYEGLIVTPAGGLPSRPWLASSWKWSIRPAVNCRLSTVNSFTSWATTPTTNGSTKKRCARRV